MNLNNLGDPPATTSMTFVSFLCIIILALVALLYKTGKLESDRKWDEKVEGQHAAKGHALPTEPLGSPKVKVFMFQYFVMPLGSDIHVLLRISCNNFGDPFTSHPPSSCPPIHHLLPLILGRSQLTLGEQRGTQWTSHQFTTINLTFMSLDCGWKQQYQEETHAGNRAYHCATMLSIFMTNTNHIPSATSLGGC